MSLTENFEEACRSGNIKTVQCQLPLENNVTKLRGLRAAFDSQNFEIAKLILQENVFAYLLDSTFEEYIDSPTISELFAKYQSSFIDSYIARNLASKSHIVIKLIKTKFPFTEEQYLVILTCALNIKEYTVIDAVLEKMSLKGKSGIIGKAVKQGNIDLAQRLLLMGATLNENEVDDVILNIPSEVELKQLVNLGLEITSQMIFPAVERNHEEVLKVIVSHQPTVNVNVMHKNQTALHLASEKGYLSIVQILQSAGANINATDAHGYTPVNCACRFNFDNIVRFLVDCGADFNIPNKYDDSPVMWAMHKRNLALAEFLFSKGANLHQVNINGTGILHHAVREDSFTIAKMCVEAGIPVDIQSKNGESPLTYGIGKCSVQLVEYMIEKGANIEQCSIKDKFTPLLIAVSWGRMDLIELLFKKKPDLNLEQCDIEGNNAILTAAKYHHWDMIFYFLDKGSSVNSVNLKQSSVLSKAIQEKQKDVVKRLMNYGVSSSKNNIYTNVCTPIKLVNAENESENFEILVQTFENVRKSLHVLLKKSEEAVAIAIKMGNSGLFIQLGAPSNIMDSFKANQTILYRVTLKPFMFAKKKQLFKSDVLVQFCK